MGTGAEMVSRRVLYKIDTISLKQCVRGMKVAHSVKCPTPDFSLGHVLPVWEFKSCAEGCFRAHLVTCSTSAQVMILGFMSLSPALGSVLTARSLEIQILCLPPSLLLPCMGLVGRSLFLSLSLSLSQE